jgi:RimJ/RimL family protein N-acetyltransferase
MELVLTRCTIREWRPGDEESLVRHANNRNVSRNLRDAFPYPYTLADARSWIETAATADPLTSFAIEVDGAAVGGIGIVLKDDIYRRSAEIGYWLGEDFWGQGIATEAVSVMTDYAFSTWDLCRIWAGIFEWNHGSGRVLEKAGYQFEGRLRQAVTKDGETIDELIFAIVRR